MRDQPRRCSLEAKRRKLETEDEAEEILRVLWRLSCWRFARQLASVRGKALAELPAEEREAWEDLWASVEEMRNSILDREP